jgi:hypothetical protein
MNGASNAADLSAVSLPAERVSPRYSLWPELLMAIAAASMVVGVLWDISWHVSVGRDTFWTAAHMAIYFGGTLGGCVGGWLATRYTFFASAEDRAASVQILGARAPLGAWVSIWGAIAMLTSGPFDDWWHNAYGLDVRIISPPHLLLGTGMFAVGIGALLLAVARQNREPDGGGGALFIFSGGVVLTLGAILITEMSMPNLQHTATFYKACGATLLVRLVTVGRAGKLSWPATRVALVYMAIQCLMIWILPLFAAQPKLAPIFNPVTHMVPPAFPLLLVIPALGMDLFLARLGDDRLGFWRTLLFGFVLAAIFLALFLPTQWFFSQFLISSRADNWFFAGNRIWGYGQPLGSWHGKYWHVTAGDNEFDPLTGGALARAWLWSGVSAFVGLGWGSWMRRVKR